ncbi:5-methyltetrahydropteroyltriglutamate--homocysteine S-methyltransferase [Paenibacillus sp. HJL G12]|uniref:5-methyltetrahydropteroyltriglutamate--homocysteine S-methyltransferase n=1 Tax=Paenibacillus dendrobii TaxID=2691084 RepID=A0A7X3IDT7_9BACL|nr:5-methyltetrahydropteroyltriglutamate--homocysteine S-methyltransferase [Paenibacillus dendrobii]MWV42078.1 5-methyltetrahydropteroyltriglutamate--homocysteine S-methyltransferase [Paenibacillus dendrobii]
MNSNTNTSKKIAPPFRADQVGSFLRPQTLKEAKAKYNEGRITKEELRSIEDAEIMKLVDKQKAVGLTAVTDGEFRRTWWHLDFIEALQGIEVYDLNASGLFHGAMSKAKGYTVASKLGFPADHPFLEDFKFLKQAAGDLVAKFTIPGPNMIFYSGVINSQKYADNPSYASLEDVAKDIVQVYRDAIQAFYDAGCRYLQLDDTSWGALFSDDFRDKIKAKGFDPDELVKQFADITIDAVANKPEDMAITIHICRGNFKSSWLYEGGYEPIAKELFSRVNVDGFFLEYDSDRAGDFKPLRHIKDQRVVLGLVTTKTGELEDKEDLKRRVQEASEYVNLDQLCLSPQCGFSSTEEGNTVTDQDQWNKLALVVETSQEIWN